MSPFKSEAQRKFMHKHHPEIAARWEKEHKTPKNLPKHVGDRRAQKPPSKARKKK